MRTRSRLCCADLFGVRLGAQVLGVELERMQAVGDVLERAEHGRLVIGRGLVESGLGRALLRAQRAAVEQRLQQIRADVPHLGAAGEQIAGVQRLRTEVAR